MIARAERDKFLERCNLGAFVPRPSVGGIALVAEIKVLQLPVCEVGHLALAIAGSVDGCVVN